MKTHCKHGHPRVPENVNKSGGCKECQRIFASAWRKEHYDRDLTSKRMTTRNTREQNKLDTLKHYSRNGVLGCCWEGCTVCDLDMLTLDHIEDDGQNHRNAAGNRRLSGDALYTWARRNNYPGNFQTLCSSHQLKKRVMKDRNSRI